MSSAYFRCIVERRRHGDPAIGLAYRVYKNKVSVVEVIVCSNIAETRCQGRLAVKKRGKDPLRAPAILPIPTVESATEHAWAVVLLS